MTIVRVGVAALCVAAVSSLGSVVMTAPSPSSRTRTADASVSRAAYKVHLRPRHQHTRSTDSRQESRARKLRAVRASRAPQPVAHQATAPNTGASRPQASPSHAAPQSEHQRTSVVLHVVQHSVRLTSDGLEVVVLGQALNESEQTFDHAVITVKLYDSHGKYLNRPMPDEIQQTAGDQIRPGALVPFEWTQAAPTGFASAVVIVTGVDPVSHASTPAGVVVSVVGRRDCEQGQATRVDGTITNQTGSEVGVLLDVAAYDAAEQLIAFGSATFGGEYLVVLEPGATARWTVKLDQPVEDLASVRTYLSVS
jgi:hypothetical protein